MSSVKSAKDRVIVTDVRYRMSLPIIRSLGKSGKTVVPTELPSTSKKLALGAYSKYASSLERLPVPKDPSFIEELRKLSSNDNPVILPVGIDSLEAIIENQNMVRDFAKIAVPTLESFHLANDKASLMEHAAGIGVPCPETTTLEPSESVAELSNRISFPAVIKYRQGELLRLDPQDRYFIAKSKDEFIAQFEIMHQKQDYPIVQEYVSGEGFGVSAVFDQNSNPLKIFCHRRLREYPIGGGPSCLCESAWNEELAAHAVRLLKSLSWTGVAMVEFKGSEETGYKLMEINPRFWGSIALAPIAGCDIASAMCDAANGVLAADSKPKPDYKLGAKMHFFLQDTLSILAYGKQSPSRVRYLLKNMWSVFNPKVRGGVFDFKDPAPAFRYLGNALKKTDKIIR